MINTTVMPKETLAELLLFLADNEKFVSVSRDLKRGVTVEETRSALRELAGELAREAGQEQGPSDVKGDVRLSRKTKDVISCLSPNEEKALLTAFGFAEK